MSLGQRIKERLQELKWDVHRLNEKTHVPISSLYELMNGRMKSSTKLPTIATALGLNALWLEKQSGPRLLSEAQTPKDWPFKFDRRRIDALSKSELALVESTILGLLNAIEGGDALHAAQKKVAK